MTDLMFRVFIDQDGNKYVRLMRSEGEVLQWLQMNPEHKLIR